MGLDSGNLRVIYFRVTGGLFWQLWLHSKLLVKYSLEREARWALSLNLTVLGSYKALFLYFGKAPWIKFKKACNFDKPGRALSLLKSSKTLPRIRYQPGILEVQFQAKFRHQMQKFSSIDLRGSILNLDRRQDLNPWPQDRCWPCEPLTWAIVVNNTQCLIQLVGFFKHFISFSYQYCQNIAHIFECIKAPNYNYSLAIWS